jgi:hypothetical protein
LLKKAFILLDEGAGGEMEQFPHARRSEPGGSCSFIEGGSAGALVRTNAEVISERSWIEGLLPVFDHDEDIGGQEQTDARYRIEQLFGSFERRMVGKRLTHLLFNRTDGLGQLFDLLLQNRDHAVMGRRAFFYGAEPIGELGSAFDEEFPGSEHRVEFGKDGFSRFPERDFVSMAGQIVGNVITSSGSVLGCERRRVAAMRAASITDTR